MWTKKLIHFGKHRSNVHCKNCTNVHTNITYVVVSKVSPRQQFSSRLDFNICCSSYFKEAQKCATFRTVDAVVSRGNLMQQMKDASFLHWQSVTIVWQQRTGRTEWDLAKSCLWRCESPTVFSKNIGTGLQKNGSRCSKLMSPNLKWR